MVVAGAPGVRTRPSGAGVGGRSGDRGLRHGFHRDRGPNAPLGMGSDGEFWMVCQPQPYRYGAGDGSPLRFGGADGSGAVETRRGGRTGGLGPGGLCLGGAGLLDQPGGTAAAAAGDHGVAGGPGGLGHPVCFNPPAGDGAGFRFGGRSDLPNGGYRPAETAGDRMVAAGLPGGDPRRWDGHGFYPRGIRLTAF